MAFRVQLSTLVLSGILLVLLIELVRRRHLKERYALLWLAIVIAFSALSLKIEILNFIARLLGIRIASNALFLLGIISLVLIVLSLTVTISGLSRKNERLAQEFAILAQRVEELERRETPENERSKIVKE